MKFLSIAFTAAGCLMLAGGASAQSCTGFSGTINGATGSVSGNSCQASSSLAQACGNVEALNGAGVAIYQVNVGSTNNYSLQVNSSAFIPWIGFIAGTCSSNTQCKDDVTTSAPGTVTTATYTDATTPGGTYYLIVGDTDVDSPGCGAFTVTWGPNLPVALQSFNVE
jgi:hypothetical protein